MSIRVLIADDHPVVRDGLRITLERSQKSIVVVGEASDGSEVVAMARTTPVDVFILDITMPNMNGIDAAMDLLKEHPAAKILMLSLHDTKAMVAESMAAGVHGFLTKEMATRHVVDAVCDVHEGRFYLCPAVAHFVIKTARSGPRAARMRGAGGSALTGRQRKVLQLIAEGHSNKEIAAKLSAAVNTIHTHRTNIMAKLNIHKQADLVRYAIRAGLAKL